MAKSMSFQELALLLGALSCGGTVACARAAEPPHTSAAPAPMRTQATVVAELKAESVTAESVAAESVVQQSPSVTSETAPTAEQTSNELVAASEAASPAIEGDARSAGSSTSTSTNEVVNTGPTSAVAAESATARPKNASTKKKSRKRGQGGCGAGTCAR